MAAAVAAAAAAAGDRFGDDDRMSWAHGHAPYAALETAQEVE